MLSSARFLFIRPVALVVRCTLIATLLVAICVACGKKGPVRPPLATLPAAPTEVTVDQQGVDFILSWTAPSYNQDASPIEDLVAFRIYRLIFDAAEGCPTCRDPEDLVATIELVRPASGVRIGKRFYWRDEAVVPGTGHAYLVAPVTISGQEGASSGGYRIWMTPPPPPLDVHAEDDRSPVHLVWKAPEAFPAKQELAGYNIYRRTGGTPFSPVPLNTAPLTGATLTDFAAETGHEVIYRVTTVTRAGDQRLESLPSAEVVVIPRGAR